jgi:hypothetical protein
MKVNVSFWNQRANKAFAYSEKQSTVRQVSHSNVERSVTYLALAMGWVAIVNRRSNNYQIQFLYLRVCWKQAAQNRRVL